MFDLTVTNSWFKYVEDYKANIKTKKYFLDLINYQIQIGELLNAALLPKSQEFEPDEKNQFEEERLLRKNV